MGCGLPPNLVYNELRELLECGLRAVRCLPAAPRVLLLRSIAVIVRGLRAAAAAVAGSVAGEE